MSLRGAEGDEAISWRPTKQGLIESEIASPHFRGGRNDLLS
jgi:hypothetical protein